MIQNEFAATWANHSKRFRFFAIRTILAVLLMMTCMQPVQAQYASTSIYELRYHQAYQNLKRKNPDLFGWITIPGTQIDAPLVQGEDNDYYLHHSPNQKKNPLGSIFMDYRNNTNFQNDNTILYGHNVHNSTDMFSTLLYYEDQDFYEQYPYIIFSLDHEIRYYKIFASYTTHTNFYYIQTQFSANQSLTDLVEAILLRNALQSQLTYQMDHRLLTLSTCSFRFENARFVVHAYLIDVKEVSP